MKTAAALILVVGLCACKGKQTHWDPKPPPAIHVPAAVETRTAKETAHPRILFTEERIARLKNAVAKRTPYWKKLEGRCAVFLGKDQSAGYLGLQWGEAIGDLVTCYYATGDTAYQERAMVYVRALVNDKQSIGDGAGGDTIVQGNSGYPIRAFGLYAALAYDWLHDAPGMDVLRPLIAQRLEAWLSWYMAGGYLNDSPYSNYFWGYFSTLAMAGLALDGEAPAAAVWQAKTKELLDDTVIPGFQAKLKGGEWAEGWQYGSLVAMEVALLVDATYTATGADLAPSFSWLSEIVHAHLHRTHPDGKTWYGNGTQHVRPPLPDSSALSSALLVLERTSPDDAARARFILRNQFPPVGKERIWFATIADDPAGQVRDPRAELGLSYHLAGPGRTYMRSSWDKDAVWVSLQAGSRVAVDHQQNDQGHFEIWRGGDALTSDFATHEGYATINHNSLLIDDGGDALNYTPNQGVWGRKSRTTAWYDDGEAVVVVADLTDAWVPKCVQRGCSKRAVDSVIRKLVYVRPDIVVIDDTIALAKGNYGATWITHLRNRPDVSENTVVTTMGSSRWELTALEGGGPEAIREPTPTEDHIYRGNKPDGEVWRVAIETARGKSDRHLRVWMRTTASSAQAGTVKKLVGEGLSGGVATEPGASVAVVFGAGGQVVVPSSVAVLFVAGLTPGTEYRVDQAASGGGCKVSVVAAAGASRRSNPGGLMSIDLAKCGK